MDPQSQSCCHQATELDDQEQALPVVAEEPAVCPYSGAVESPVPVAADS